MGRMGRKAGVGLALLFSAAAATACGSAAEGGSNAQMIGLWTGAGFFAVTSLLGWWIGSRFDRMKEWAERDTLTRVFTRRFLRHVYPRLVAQADRRNKRFSVLLVDVNGFKAINDTLGHAKGDELLRKFADGMLDAARHGEIVGRWGGDEYLILCPYGDLTSIESFQKKIGERMAQIGSEWNRNMSVSAGSAVYPEDGRVLEELVQEADRRMYAEKNRSKETLPQRLNA